MSKKIFTINYEIPGYSELYLDYTSKKSLMDADIIVFDPVTPYYEKSDAGDGQYLGKTCYGEHGSFLLKEDLNHWKKELINALKVGKTIILLLNSKEVYFIDSGTRSYTGTGRNRGTTINVEPGNNYQILPIDIGSITSAQGTHIEPPRHPLLHSFYEQFKTNLEYRVYLENLPDSAKTIFTGKDKSKALGALYKAGAGNLIVLPYLNYDEQEFIEYEEAEDEETEAVWTKDANIFGNKLINCILSIDKGLNQEISKTPPPSWVESEQYYTKKEINISLGINEIDKQIEELNNEKKKLSVHLLEEQIIKDLLYEQGKPLETAVIEALKILGYKAENYDDGDLEIDQVIISPENHRYIGECEGKDKKDIDISKFRQLVDALNEDFNRDEVEEKAFGILFGNPERFKIPTERSLDFTKKCKAGAKRESIALIKTADLFVVAKYLKENNDEEFKLSCREEIHSQLGDIVVFPTPPE